LDRPIRQVLIKALVVEVTHSDNSDLGADLNAANLRANGKGQTITSVLGNVASQNTNGGMAISILENQVNATLHLLQQQGKLDVLSRPSILATDNQQATIQVGQQLPYISNVTFSGNGNQINTVAYASIGIILDVTPHINPDGLVTMDVAPEISSISDSSVTIQAGVAQPIINTRQANSRVQVRDGNTIVIGGLMQDQKTQTVNKVPILGDIPIIGNIFRRTQTTKSKTELLIFLTPHVAAEAEQLKPMSQDELKGTRLTPNAVEPGVFQKHLRDMERGAYPASQPSGTVDPVTSFDLSPGRGNPTPNPQQEARPPR
jgi:general secretion pathway protein D